MESPTNNHIRVFEHEIVRFDRGEKKITEEQFKALQLYYGKGVPYFKLCYNGVQFCEYVGVLQVGKTLIEVLPKADKNPSTELEKQKWHNILMGIVKTVNTLDLKSTGNSDLKIKANSILDLYFDLFIKEVEYLIHNGLIKKYRKIEENQVALKGRLQFSKHIQQNLTHQERFYVSHSTYDNDHHLHHILYKTIGLIKQINTNPNLQSRISSLLLNFPEMPDLKVSEATFNKIVFNRKTQHYQNAIEISKLLLLQYHPDVSKGRNNVLALMFDMNVLWEKFIYVSLKKWLGNNFTITSQTSKYFWKSNHNFQSKIRPDIVINAGTANCVVLDTKWKNLSGYNPSPEDLRQMYVYHEYFGAKKVALVYPNHVSNITDGTYYPSNSSTDFMKTCGIIEVAIEKDIKVWQREICWVLMSWMEKDINEPNV
jgi:5-methylcytosine-specific restriction enzyme subunit McrC